MSVSRCREDLNEARLALEAAYQEEFKVGAMVSYDAGRSIVTVQIVQAWGRYRCRVYNPKTKRDYFIDYDQIAQVVP